MHPMHCCIFRCRELSWSWGAQTGVQAGWVLAPARALSELSVPVLCSDRPPFPNLELVPGLYLGHELCLTRARNCPVGLHRCSKGKLLPRLGFLSTELLLEGSHMIRKGTVCPLSSAQLSLPSQGSSCDSQGSLSCLLLQEVLCQHPTHPCSRLSMPALHLLS